MAVCDPHWSPLYFVFGHQLCNLQRSNLEFASHFERFHYFVDLFERFLTFIVKNFNDLYNFKDHFIHLVTTYFVRNGRVILSLSLKTIHSCSYFDIGAFTLITPLLDKWHKVLCWRQAACWFPNAQPQNSHTGTILIKWLLGPLSLAFNWLILTY